MKDRIRELWAQCVIKHTKTPMNWQDVADEFAELIVRECIAICKDIDGEDNIDARSGRQDCAVEIQEHFGVEE